MLSLRNKSTDQPHPYIKCQNISCGKWRKLPALLSDVSPSLPSVPLTLAALQALKASPLPFPFLCRNIPFPIGVSCADPQDFDDMIYEWSQPPVRFVRSRPRFDFYIALAHFLRIKGLHVFQYPTVGEKPVDLFALYTAVDQLGGDALVTQREQWADVYRLLKLPALESNPVFLNDLIAIYRNYFFEQ